WRSLSGLFLVPGTMVPRAGRRRGSVTEELQQILTPEGELAGEPPLGMEETRGLYRAMVAARLFDRKATALQKQGRLATYAPFEGQERSEERRVGKEGR